MAIQRYKPEQIVTLLRQIEVGIGTGKRHGNPVTKQASPRKPYDRWQKEYGGLNPQVFRHSVSKSERALTVEGSRGLESDAGISAGITGGNW